MVVRQPCGSRPANHEPDRVARPPASGGRVDGRRHGRHDRGDRGSGDGTCRGHLRRNRDGGRRDLGGRRLPAPGPAPGTLGVAAAPVRRPARWTWPQAPDRRPARWTWPGAMPDPAGQIRHAPLPSAAAAPVPPSGPPSARLGHVAYGFVGPPRAPGSRNAVVRTGGRRLRRATPSPPVGGGLRQSVPAPGRSHRGGIAWSDRRGAHRVAIRHALPADAHRGRIARGGRATARSPATSPRARSPTPISTTSTSISRGLILRYGDHRGLLGAARAGRRRRRPRPAARTRCRSARTTCSATVGAAGALFVVATALLEPGDEIVVVRPNYATNLETPRAIGADVRILDLQPEEGWATDPDALAALMSPRTRLVSITNPHNPTGALVDEARSAPDRRPRRGAPDGAPPRGRDVPRDDLRRAAPAGGDALAARHRRVGDVEDLRAAGDPDRLADDPRPGAHDDPAGGEGADPHHAARSSTSRSRPVPSSVGAELLPAILDGIVAGLATVRAWLAAEPRIAWVEPRGGVVGFPWIRPDAGVGSRRLPPGPRRAPRHGRRPGSLVRAAALVLPARLRVAASRGARRGPRPDLAHPRRGGRRRGVRPPGGGAA